MAPSPNLSTPKCPEEQRAWLLIYQRRLGMKKSLVEAFSKRFPGREETEILRHAAHVLNSSSEDKSKLEKLAATYPWYEDPPKKGERYYRNTKRAEKREDAKERKKQKKLQRKADSANQDADPDADEPKAPPPSPSSQTRAEAYSPFTKSSGSSYSPNIISESGRTPSPISTANSNGVARTGTRSEDTKSETMRAVVIDMTDDR